MSNYYYKTVELSELEGEIIADIKLFERTPWFYTGHRNEVVTVPAGSISFYTTSGKIFSMYHGQECCEFVELIDIIGDLNSLIGTKIISIEKRMSDKFQDLVDNKENLNKYQLYYGEEELWTFYIIQGEKDSVTLRWYGESNGYYSVEVNFCQIIAKENKNI